DLIVDLRAFPKFRRPLQEVLPCAGKPVLTEGDLILRYIRSSHQPPIIAGANEMHEDVEEHRELLLLFQILKILHESAFRDAVPQHQDRDEFFVLADAEGDRLQPAYRAEISLE